MNRDLYEEMMSYKCFFFTAVLSQNS